MQEKYKKVPLLNKTTPTPDKNFEQTHVLRTNPFKD